MAWSEFFKQLVLTLATTLGAGGLLIWLIKSLASHWLSKDIERFKENLKDENARAIERLRNDLRMDAVEHEVRFRKLHERQADIIAAVFDALYDLYKKVCSYVNVIDYANEPDKRGKLELAACAHRKFRELYFPKRLYFPDDVARRIEAFNQRLIDITDRFSEGLRKQEAGADSRHWSEAWTSIEEDAIPIFDHIRQEFQRLIGVRRDVEPHLNQGPPCSTRNELKGPGVV